MSGIGLICRWECPTCGKILKTQSPAWNKKILKASFDEPKKCACGRKGSFTLLNLDSCIYEVLPEGYTVTHDDKGFKLVKEEDKEDK